MITWLTSDQKMTWIKDGYYQLAIKTAWSDLRGVSRGIAAIRKSKLSREACSRRWELSFLAESHANPSKKIFSRAEDEHYGQIAHGRCESILNGDLTSLRLLIIATLLAPWRSRVVLVQSLGKHPEPDRNRSNVVFWCTSNYINKCITRVEPRKG